MMVENALFEEEQNQGKKAEKIYDSLTTEVAPGHIKSIIAYINFEKRQKNDEKVKDLYFKAFSSAISKNDGQAVTYLGVQYANFNAFNCNDVTRACDILSQATSAIKTSKVLFLSQTNFLKHLEGLSQSGT